MGVIPHIKIKNMTTYIYKGQKISHSKISSLLRSAGIYGGNKLSYYDNVCNEIKEIEKNRDNLSDNYARLAGDYEYLNKCVQNQANTITRYIEENKSLTEEVEKLKGKLDRASKRYGELIKTISDRAIKLI